MLYNVADCCLRLVNSILFTISRYGETEILSESKVWANITRFYNSFYNIYENITTYLLLAVALLVFCAMVEVLVAAIVKRKKGEKEGGAFTLEMAMCDLSFAVLIMLCLLSEASVPSLLA